MKRKKTVIMGAAGRDFHNFNVYYRERPEVEVTAFTAAQIPNIEGRVYPPVLSGPHYPEGIPIYPESELPRLVREGGAEEVVFAYSDVSHEYVMHRASLVLALGADFKLMGPDSTLLKAEVPVVSVGAVRTGAGKSQTTRKIARILKGMGLRVVVVRHPMPYGDLTRQICQRFESEADLDRQNCTIEEREEYMGHLEQGMIVYAGIDYAEILKRAEAEADVLVWDGGNNDFPFYRPDLHVVVTDPLRPGHEISYHPGEANLRMADCVIINKVDTAAPENVASVKANIAQVNPAAILIEAASPIRADKPELFRKRKVLAVEDGPTVTHGGMGFGAAYLAAKKFGGLLVDPRPYAAGSLREVYAAYPRLKEVLPAMGYSEQQIEDLRRTIEDTPCDVVASGTPADLHRLTGVSKLFVRVSYELEERSGPKLEEVLEKIFPEKSLQKGKYKLL